MKVAFKVEYNPYVRDTFRDSVMVNYPRIAMGRCTKKSEYRNMELLMTRQTAIALTCILMVSRHFYDWLAVHRCDGKHQIDDLGHSQEMW